MVTSTHDRPMKGELAVPGGSIAMRPTPSTDRARDPNHRATTASHARILDVDADRLREEAAAPALASTSPPPEPAPMARLGCSEYCSFVPGDGEGQPLKWPQIVALLDRGVLLLDGADDYPLDEEHEPKRPSEMAVSAASLFATTDLGARAIALLALRVYGLCPCRTALIESVAAVQPLGPYLQQRLFYRGKPPTMTGSCCGDDLDPSDEPAWLTEVGV